MVDEETFARVFGRTDWTAMCILASGGRSYARLRFNVGPGGEMEIPVQVDFQHPFSASDHAAWREEYAACVQRADPVPSVRRDLLGSFGDVRPFDPWDDDFWLMDRLDPPLAPRQEKNPSERRGDDEL